MADRSSLLSNAILALLLMLGFYLLVLVIVLICFLLPVLAFYAVPIFGGLALIPMWVIGGTIVRSLILSSGTSTQPGVEITRQDQSELWGLVTALAKEIKTSPPHKIYINLEPNACVRADGGILGFLSDFVVCIGLPQLATINASELKAIIAHELAHCSGSTVPLGQWIFSARDRAIQIAHQLKARGSWVSGFFTDFLEFYLVYTQKISRIQEVDADRISVAVAGAAPLASYLRKSMLVGMSWSAFCESELEPALKRNCFLAITENFSRFFGKPHAEGQLETLTAKLLELEPATEYDSHPTVRSRLKTIEALSSSGFTNDPRPATSMLHDLPHLERELIVWSSGRESVRGFKAVTFEQTKELVTVPYYEEVASQWPALVKEFTPATLPVNEQKFGVWVKSIRRPLELDRYRNDFTGIARTILIAALTLRLIQDGWELQRELGKPDKVIKGSHSIDPTYVIYQLFGEPGYQSEWLNICQQAGIADLRFSEIQCSPDRTSSMK